MRSRVLLEILDGPLKGKKFEFAEHDAFIFGRAPDCHAHLPDHTALNNFSERSPAHVHRLTRGTLNDSPRDHISEL
jgi:hypothetical protein